MDLVPCDCAGDSRHERNHDILAPVCFFGEKVGMEHRCEYITLKTIWRMQSKPTNIDSFIQSAKWSDLFSTRVLALNDRTSFDHRNKKQTSFHPRQNTATITIFYTFAIDFFVFTSNNTILEERKKNTIKMLMLSRIKRRKKRNITGCNIFWSEI